MRAQPCALAATPPTRSPGARSGRAACSATARARRPARRGRPELRRTLDHAQGEQQQEPGVERPAGVEAPLVRQLVDDERRPDPRQAARDDGSRLADRPPADPPDDDRGDGRERDGNEPKRQPAASRDPEQRHRREHLLRAAVRLAPEVGRRAHHRRGGPSARQPPRRCPGYRAQSDGPTRGGRLRRRRGVGTKSSTAPSLSTDGSDGRRA